jgi:hypothetical protein
VRTGSNAPEVSVRCHAIPHGHGRDHGQVRRAVAACVPDDHQWAAGDGSGKRDLPWERRPNVLAWDRREVDASVSSTEPLVNLEGPQHR